MTHPTFERLLSSITDKDIEQFGSLYAEDAVLHEPMLDEPALGREAIMRGERSLMTAFSDLGVRVRSLTSSDRQIIAEVVMTAVNDGPLEAAEGTIPATGNRIEVPMAWFIELDPRSGLIIEERDYFDAALIMRQLGL